MDGRALQIGGQDRTVGAPAGVCNSGRLPILQNCWQIVLIVICYDRFSCNIRLRRR
jgi:hypothetical protein